jgi:hypothetical protein
MIKAKKGKKHPDDKVIFINGHQITYIELAKICVIFCKNEDNIYPPPKFKGGDMTKEFLVECMERRSVDEDLIIKYELT